MQRRNHVVKRALGVIHHQLHVDLRVARATHVVRERKAALPTGRDVLAPKAFEDDGGILRVDRHRRNVRQVRSGVGGSEALGIRHRGHSGRQRIARVDLRVEDRAALNAAHRPPRDPRIRITRHVAILFRIGIDDQRGGMMLFRELGLYSAIALAVAGEDDFSFDAHAKRRQFAVIIERAVICVDDRSGHISRRRINVECADGALVVCGVIAVERRSGVAERLCARASRARVALRAAAAAMRCS